MKKQISTNSLVQIEIKNAVDQLSNLSAIIGTIDDEHFKSDVLGTVRSIKAKVNGLNGYISRQHDINIVDVVDNGTINAPIGHDDTFGADYDKDKAKLNNGVIDKKNNLTVIGNSIKYYTNLIVKISNDINRKDVNSPTSTILRHLNRILISTNNSLNIIQRLKASYGDSLRQLAQQANLEPYEHLEDKVNDEFLDELFKNRDNYTQKIASYINSVEQEYK